MYTKLLSFDITAAAFVPRQTGFAGEAPADIRDLSHSHPQIKFRKDFLARYLAKLVALDYESPESWEYLDKVAVMHTGKAGFAHRAKKPALRVEYIHCAILLGFVEGILVDAVMGHPDLDTPTKTAVLRAVNKILWIQNDLFARHYITDAAAVAATKVVLDKSVAATAVLGLIAAGAVLARFLL